jgi:hypothetical protein
MSALKIPAKKFLEAKHRKIIQDAFDRVAETRARQFWEEHDALCD